MIKAKEVNNLTTNAINELAQRMLNDVEQGILDAARCGVYYVRYPRHDTDNDIVLNRVIDYLGKNGFSVDTYADRLEISWDNY